MSAPVTEPEYEDILAGLSVPGDDAAGVSRRRFLQGLLGGAGAVALSGTALGRAAAAATAPAGAGDGILVVIMLGGGNDGLNTLIPTADPEYRRLRPTIAIPTVLPLGEGLGLHPNLARLKARYDAGRVAVVRGVGKPDGDHSHFSSMATWMAGTAGTDRDTGWLGRWLDGVPDAHLGFRGMHLGSSIPLHMLGRGSSVTALPTNGIAPFGADRTEPYEAALFDAIAAYGDSPSGKGSWGDELGSLAAASMERASRVEPLYDGAPRPPGDLTNQLGLAARLINLDLGVRVVSAGFGSFDTHAAQTTTHAELLADLDGAVDLFYRRLGPGWAGRVTLVTFSEFGRRVEQNASSGTDHGTAGTMFLIGDRVRGGLHGIQPSLTDLDSRGDLRVPIDFRSVYGSVLGEWLATDPASVIGGSYPALDLFA